MPRHLNPAQKAFSDSNVLDFRGDSSVNIISDCELEKNDSTNVAGMGTSTNCYASVYDSQAMRNKRPRNSISSSVKTPTGRTRSEKLYSRQPLPKGAAKKRSITTEFGLTKKN